MRQSWRTPSGRWTSDRIDKNQKLFSLNADKLMMPASNMKILTLATAAEVLGWDARMTTTLDASGPVEDGVLRGDLFVRGGGDPTINTRDGVGNFRILGLGDRAARCRGQVR